MKFSLRAAGIVAALFVASCGQVDDTAMRAEEPSESTPDISPTAAPGVAFAYGYDFRLADERIDEVQEAHASDCERLGLNRCRITGMRYSLGAEEQVYGMLQVKLEPAIARQFGKNAVQGVEKTGGRLINAEFTGTDEGSAIRRTDAQRAELERQIDEIEQQLTEPGLDDRERTELQQQLSLLRNQVAQTRTTIAESEERLELTPMTFNYYGKGGVPGFGGRNPIEESWRTFIQSGATMISVVLWLVGALLPWALLLLLIVLLVRSAAGRSVRSWWKRSSYSTPQEE